VNKNLNIKTNAPYSYYIKLNIKFSTRSFMFLKMKYYFICILASIFLITNTNCINDNNDTKTTISSNFNLDKELNYQLLIQPDGNSSLSITHLNNSEELKNVNNKSDSNSTAKKNIDDETLTIKFINFFRSIDRYTLILISAFVSGLFLMGFLICLALCICKTVNRLNRKNKLPEITNPAYDEKVNLNGSSLIVKYTPIDQIDDDLFEENEKGGTLTNKNGKVTLCEGETDFDVDPQLKKTSSEETLKQDDSSSASSSSSSLSFNRVPLTPKTPPPPIDDNNHQDSTDHTPLFHKNLVKKISGSNLFNRTNSESHDKLNQNNNNSNILKTTSSIMSLKKIGLSRKSIASSSTSIQQPQQQLDFQKIQDDIEHMALNKNLIKTDSTSSNIRQTSTSSNQVDSSDNLHKQESVSDIYFEYIKKKREEQVASKQKSKINDLIKDNNKRHSINAIQVSFNPNGVSGSTNNPISNNQANVSNLMSNDSMSVDTLGSEKSCY
jgi:hypothetical protein